MDETIVKEPEPVIETPKPGETVVEPAAPATEPGAKTESVLLLKSLQETREKLRIAEAALAVKGSEPDNSGVIVSDEGRALDEKISRLEGQVASREASDRLGAVQTVYPVLKDKQQEFDDFRNSPENAGMRIETAAKAFLVENNLFEQPVQRKGLERETGGVRVPPQTGMTPQEVDELRVNNYREYVKRLKNGTLTVS